MGRQEELYKEVKPSGISLVSQLSRWRNNCRYRRRLSNSDTAAPTDVILGPDNRGVPGSGKSPESEQAAVAQEHREMLAVLKTRRQREQEKEEENRKKK